jgi:hypothetical protein
MGKGHLRDLVLVVLVADDHGHGISVDRAIRAAPTGRRSYWSHNGCSVGACVWQGPDDQTTDCFDLYDDGQIALRQRFPLSLWRVC